VQRRAPPGVRTQTVLRDHPPDTGRVPRAVFDNRIAFRVH